MYKNIIVNDDILDLESKYRIWEYKFLKYSLYFSIRPFILKGASKLRNKKNLKSLFLGLLVDCCTLLRVGASLRKFKTACFISERGLKINSIFEKNQDKIIYFISDNDNKKFNNNQINNLYLSDSIILTTRLVLYFIQIINLPILIIFHWNLITIYHKFLFKVSNSSKLKVIFIINKSISDIIFCILIKKIFKKIIISGGSCPNIITNLIENDKNDILEIQHGLIGRGHQLYAGIKPKQVTLIKTSQILEIIENRAIDDISFLNKNDKGIYNFDRSGEFVYFGSPFDYYSIIKSDNIKNKFHYKPHPRLINKYSNNNININKIRYSLIEPSSLIVTLRDQKIPFAIVCYLEDIESIKSYFIINDPDQLFIDPRYIELNFLNL